MGVFGRAPAGQCSVGFTGTQVRGESKHSKASLHAQRGHLCVCSVGCIVVRIPGVVPRVYTRPFWRGQSLVRSGHLCCDIQQTTLQRCNVPEGRSRTWPASSRFQACWEPCIRVHFPFPACAMGARLTCVHVLCLTSDNKYMSLDYAHFCDSFTPCA